MLEKQDTQLGEQERAYTAPAEADASTAFQFHSDLTPPAAQKKRRERNGRKWAVAITCIVLVFLCLALAVSLFFLRYQVILSRDDGSLGFRIARREAAVIAPNDIWNMGNPGEERPRNAAAGIGDYQWNGARLELEAPQIPEGLSCSAVYQERYSCVAAVTATDADANVSKGSAIVMSEDGFLITSSHVVLYADSILVELEGQSYPAVLIGLDIASDLAVIRIQATGLKPAEFGLSESMDPGDEIAVLGTTLSGATGIYSGTLTASVSGYSYRGFTIDLFELYRSLADQCSGAPVINRCGQVIGIVNTDIAHQYQDPGNASFAVPIHAAKGIIDQLLEYGYVPGRPSSGLTVAEIPAAYAMYYKYPSCVYVAAVNDSSTAYEAGVRKGDLILSANGIKIQSVDQLYAVINGMEAGDDLSLELYREGDVATLTFKLMEATRPAG